MSWTTKDTEDMAIGAGAYYGGSFLIAFYPAWVMACYFAGFQVTEDNILTILLSFTITYVICAISAALIKESYICAVIWLVLYGSCFMPFIKIIRWMFADDLGGKPPLEPYNFPLSWLWSSGFLFFAIFFIIIFILIKKAKK